MKEKMIQYFEGCGFEIKEKMRKITKCLDCGKVTMCILFKGSQGDYCFWKCRDCAKKHLGYGVKRWQ